MSERSREHGKDRGQPGENGPYQSLLPTGVSIDLATTGPISWSGQSARDGSPKTDDFLLQLDHKDIEEINRGLHTFKSNGLDGDEIDPKKFPLPTVKHKLERATVNIHSGSGINNVRGLDPSQYSDEDNLLIFLGLASYVGDVRGVQNRKGDMITHITDARQWDAPYSVRHGIHTNENLPFHNDMGTDILALQVRQCAQEGGQTYVASVGSIAGELVKHRPDVIATLSLDNWPIQVSNSPNRFVLVPLLQLHEGKLMISLDPGRLGLHPTMARHFGGEVIPRLTPVQEEALHVLSIVATEHRLRIDTQPGDMVFINNWALLHARSSYKDCDSECGPRRHLVRLWLRNSALGWNIPVGMRVQWEAAFGPDGMGDKNPESGRIGKTKHGTWRGGGTLQRNYPVVPAPVYKAPRYTSASAAFVIEESDESSDDLN